MAMSLLTVDLIEALKLDLQQSIDRHDMGGHIMPPSKRKSRFKGKVYAVPF